jgi:hypothetical protein
MLWSVSVCDIIYKLQYLVDLYADSAAKEILGSQASAWERDINYLFSIHKLHLSALCKKTKGMAQNQRSLH